MRANFLLPCELISSAGILCFHFPSTHAAHPSAPPSSLSFVLFYYLNESSLHAVLCSVYLMSCLKVSLKSVALSITGWLTILQAVSVVKLPFRTPRAPVEHFCPPDLVPRDITACPVYHDALSNITPVTLKLTNHFAPGQTYLYSSWLCHIRCLDQYLVWLYYGDSHQLCCALPVCWRSGPKLCVDPRPTNPTYFSRAYSEFGYVSRFSGHSKSLSVFHCV